MTRTLSQPILPPDDLARALVLAQADAGNLPHIGLAGGTYTILLGGKDTAGKYCVIDMLVPPGGGPALHRHDFEETFILLQGEIVATFRGEQKVAKAGESLHIPANAPHKFRNASNETVRMLCICAPAGQEEFFQAVGVPVSGRTTPPPPATPEQMEQVQRKAAELAPKYVTEFLAED